MHWQVASLPHKSCFVHECALCVTHGGRAVMKVPGACANSRAPKGRVLIGHRTANMPPSPTTVVSPLFCFPGRLFLGDSCSGCPSSQRKLQHNDAQARMHHGGQRRHDTLGVPRQALCDVRASVGISQRSPPNPPEEFLWSFYGIRVASFDGVPCVSTSASTRANKCTASI